MPKINVYVPDELAEAIKEAGIPVSAVCQRALETAVRRVTAIRAAVQSPSWDLDERSGRLARFTDRASTVVRLAVQEARTESAPEVGTEHLLIGLLAEGGNMAIQVLGALEIEPEHLRRELDRQRSSPSEAVPAASDEATAAAPPDPAIPADSGARIGNQAAAALELAVTEATSLGHNYVGCEHLLLGLIAEPDGIAGRVLRSLGADLRLTRRAVMAAVAGYYVHARKQDKTTSDAPPALTDPMTKLSALIDQQLKPVVRRIESLEKNIKLR
jgi:ATP-dependent Clp protease ATP-binding subunit ClpA/post-segregation antitoxin (ccd killing protein)